MNFQYSKGIPKIVYDYSNYTIAFDMADPTFYEIKNKTTLYKQIQENLIEYIKFLSNGQIVIKENTSKVQLKDRINNFNTYIYLEANHSLNGMLGGIQDWRLLNEIGNLSVSTFINFINYTSPISVQMFHSIFFDLFSKTLTDNNSSLIFSNYPQPVSSFTQKMMKIKVCLIPLHFLFFPLSTLIYLIVIEIFREINTVSYKIQKIYGGLITYWLSNFLLNIIESFIIDIPFILMIQYLFQISIENIWLFAFFHSLSIILFYYFLIIIWNKSQNRLALSKDILL